MSFFRTDKDRQWEVMASSGYIPFIDPSLQLEAKGRTVRTLNLVKGKQLYSTVPLWYLDYPKDGLSEKLEEEIKRNENRFGGFANMIQLETKLIRPSSFSEKSGLLTMAYFYLDPIQEKPRSLFPLVLTNTVKK